MTKLPIYSYTRPQDDASQSYKLPFRNRGPHHSARAFLFVAPLVVHVAYTGLEPSAEDVHTSGAAEKQQVAPERVEAPCFGL